MRTKIYKFRIFIAIAIIFCEVLPTFAHDFEVDGIYYTITDETDKTVAVTYRGSYSYNYSNEYSGSVTIPSSVTYSGITYSVTSIGSGAFYECTGLTSVTIPNSVTAIGDNAFYNCTGLTSVTIGNSVTEIGDRAFSGCTGLTSVTIPNSVTEIGDRAFGGCTGLTSMVVASGNSVYDSRDNCNAIIETATNTLFAGCNNSTIPNSVTSIGDYAFSGCLGLTSVTICNSVIEIGNSAFSGCTGLTSVTIGNSVTKIGSSAFSSCSSLASVTIPNSVTEIGDDAFNGCSGLTELIIDDGPGILSLGYDNYNSTNNSSIGEAQFYDCPLEKLYLGRNLSYETNQQYGYSPFYNKSTLKTVTIGNSVSKIISSAFDGCSGLTEVNILDLSAWCEIEFGDLTANPLYYAKKLKLNGSDITDLVIPDNITKINNYAFYNCSGLTSVTIPNSVTKIGYYAFHDTKWYDNQADGVIYINNVLYNYKGTMPEGTSIDIKDGTVSVSPSAFAGYIGMTSVTIPNSVTAIGDRAFGGCTGLTSVTIPNSVTEIGEYAFEECGSFEEVNYNAENCTTMEYSFSGCYIRTLNIGKDVKNIPEYAFDNYWGSIDQINISATTPPTIGVNSFYYYTYLQVPAVSIYLYKNHPIWSKFRVYAQSINVDGISYEITSESDVQVVGFSRELHPKTLNIPPSIVVNDKNYNVTSICEMFSIGDTLTSVTIPNSITSIGKEVFKDCSRLTSITIGNSVTSIGERAFYNTGWYNNQADGILYLDNYCLGYKGTKPTGSLSINANTRVIADNAFNRCPGITNVNLPNSITNIGNYAFNACKGITTATIGNSLTKIGEYAFNGCSGLTSISIPQSVTSIGKDAFKSTNWYNNQGDGILYLNNCCLGYKGDSPTSALYIANGTRVIADYAFNNCADLTSVNFPNSITNIGKYAFDGCTGLSYTTIPNSVTEIGEYGFSSCNNIMLLATIPPTIGMNSFNYKATINVLPGAIFAYNKNISWNNYNIRELSNIDGVIYGNISETEALVVSCNKNELSPALVIPSNVVLYDSNFNVTSIGNSAFMGCTQLTSATIPNSVTRIGLSAFSGCSQLSYISIPNSVAEIGDYAFSGTKITDILLGEKIESLSETVLPNGTTYIILYTSVPPKVIEDNSVEYISKTTLVVPSLSVDAYASHSFWGRAKKIIANSEYEGYYISPVPDGLYFAEKGGNICYFDGECIVDTEIPAGANAFQMASCKGALYVANAGEQYYYINDEYNTLGDGELYVVGWSNRGFRKMTIVNNKNLGDEKNYQAFLDPFHVMIDEDKLYYTCRSFSMGGVKVLPLQEIYYDTPYMTSDEVPVFATADKLPYYNRQLSYGAIHAGLQRDSEGVYWHALNYNGNCIIRYKQSHIYASVKEAQSASIPYPVIAQGIKLSAMFLDEKNDYIYVFSTASWNHGVYRMPISTIRNGGSTSFPSAWELIDDSPASPENTTSDEGIYVRQFTSDGNYVYWAYIAEEGSGNKSGIKRVNATGTPIVEYVVEDVEAYGICSHKYDASNGIETIEVEDSIDVVEIARYDIHGRLLIEPTKGINIIKMSDGSTRKEFVK